MVNECRGSGGLYRDERADGCCAVVLWNKGKERYGLSLGCSRARVGAGGMRGGWGVVVGWDVGRVGGGAVGRVWSGWGVGVEGMWSGCGVGCGVVCGAGGGDGEACVVGVGGGPEASGKREWCALMRQSPCPVPSPTE